MSMMSGEEHDVVESHLTEELEAVVVVEQMKSMFTDDHSC
jgi:hypothetical protein